MARRVTLSTVLLIGSATLVVAVFVGNSMGNRVLGSLGRLPAIEATPVAIPTSESTAPASQTWKHVTLAAIATDPGFPDPRITPPPQPPPPTFVPRAYNASPVALPTSARYVVPRPTAIATFDYTSPPLPLPILTATPLPQPTFTPAPIVDTPPAALPSVRLTPNAVGP